MNKYLQRCVAVLVFGESEAPVVLLVHMSMAHQKHPHQRPFVALPDQILLEQVL